METPDRAFNYMLNRWYLYQVYSSRLFARAGFYQVGGATGFAAKATFKCPKKQRKAYRKLFKKKGAPKSAKYR